LRDGRAAATGHPPAATRAPGPPVDLAAVVRPGAGTLAERRPPRDLLEFLWPVRAPPAHRGVEHRVDCRVCAAPVGPGRAPGCDWGRRGFWDRPVWQGHHLLHPWDR